MQTTRPIAFCPSCRQALPENMTACPRCTPKVIRPITKLDSRTPVPVFPPGAWIGSRFEVVCRLPQTGPERAYLVRDHQSHGELSIVHLISPSRARIGFPRDLLREALSWARQVHHGGFVCPRELVLGEPSLLVSEYMEGLSLSRILGGPTPDGQVSPGLPVSRVLAVATQITEALEVLHRQSRFHGDLRTESIMIGRERTGEVARILDLALTGPELVQNEDFLPTQAIHPTRAPEWFRNRGSVGTPSDVFSLAALVYWMLAGRPPFGGPDLAESLQKQCVPPHSRIPTPAYHVLLRALDREPKERHSSAWALMVDLERTLRGLLPMPDPAGSPGRQANPPINSLQETFWVLLVGLLLFLAVVYGGLLTSHGGISGFLG